MRSLIGIVATLSLAAGSASQAQMFNGFAGNLAIDNVVRNSTSPRFRPGIVERGERPSFSQGATSGSLPFDPASSAARIAKEDYLARLRRKDPQAAAALAEQMQKHDFGRIYTGIVAPYGLRRNDAVDAMTAYMMLGWLIATGSPDPQRAQVGSMRARIGAAMAAEPKFRDVTTRAALGEEMVISFVTLHAGWKAAQREGNVRQYADGVAAMFSQQGTDLRRLRLTDQGLVGG